MKKNLLLVSFLSVSLFFSSCNKDEEIMKMDQSEVADETSSTNLVDESAANGILTDGTSKKWKWIKHEQNGKSVTIPTCDLNNTFEYYADGSRIVNVADTACNKHVISPQQIYSSQWSFVGKDSIKLENGNNNAYYKIKALTQDMLSLEATIATEDTAGNSSNVTLVETFMAVSK